MDRNKAVYLMLFPDKCWHETDKGRWNECEVWGWDECIYCKKQNRELPINPDLTSWAGFGLLWERAQEMEWWQKFINWLWETEGDHSWTTHASPHIIEYEHIDPPRFLDALYSFGRDTGRINEGE